MPRPGPRPYECVRRAWHSDHHGPTRGSLIQQIFRVVNEAHAAETKKNKEWQEKLPVVVLKAEQIMYSKANSETEYSNLETLWERVNDAINTIIRREETTETGDLLPPCVEAALNLGCVPVRASRSQRHINPRTYLTPGPRPQEPPNLPARVADRTVDERRPQMLPFHPGSQPSSFARTPVGNPPNFHPGVPNTGSNSNYVAPVASPENSGSVYPLYYGARFPNDEYRVPRETARPEIIYVGKPVVPEPTTTRRDYFACPDARENPPPPPLLPPPREPECDLSLRLGTTPEPPRRSDKSSVRGTNDDNDDHDTRRLTTRGKEFCFFPGKAAGDSFEGPSSKGKKPFRGVSSDWFNT